MSNFYTRIRFEGTIEQQVIADTLEQAEERSFESLQNLSGFVTDIEKLWSHTSDVPLPAETKVQLRERE